MNAEEFVNAIKISVEEGYIKGILSQIDEPAGRSPRKERLAF